MKEVKDKLFALVSDGTHAECQILVSRALIAGGGAPETELSINLAKHANTLSGMDSYCVRAFSEALEVVPYTLAENAGLNPIATVTELRNKHAQGEKTAGINVRKVGKMPLKISIYVVPCYTRQLFYSQRNFR